MFSDFLVIVSDLDVQRLSCDRGRLCLGDIDDKRLSD
jgi:hypothetical protein